MVRHCDDPMEIDRPSNAPAAAGHRYGRGRTLSAAPAARAGIAGGSHPLGGARHVRSDGTPDPRAHRFARRGREHPPWGACYPGLLDAQRLGGRVPTARDTCPPMASLRTAIEQALSSRRHMCCTASTLTLILLKYNRYHRIMSSKMLLVICASLSHNSSLCRIIIHGVMVRFVRPRGRGGLLSWLGVGAREHPTPYLGMGQISAHA